MADLDYDSRQQELTHLLDTILEHPAVASTEPDPRLRRVHYDWLQAGDHTQRTVADLSKQLRRFLDDQAWLENRRIMDLLRGIEAKSLTVLESPPPTMPAFMEMRETSATASGMPARSRFASSSNPARLSMASRKSSPISKLPMPHSPSRWTNPPRMCWNGPA